MFQKTYSEKSGARAIYLFIYLLTYLFIHFGGTKGNNCFNGFINNV